MVDCRCDGAVRPAFKSAHSAHATSGDTVWPGGAMLFSLCGHALSLLLLLDKEELEELAVPSCTLGRCRRARQRVRASWSASVPN